MYILEIESICQTTNHVIGFHYLRITFQYVGIQFLQKFLNFKLIIHFNNQRENAGWLYIWSQ